ncbi:hypothetical protein BDD43_0753 [Mucilaginibacter gracilis]|uniref:Uncharacterized protein n=1 Tax=Mucilaginibacter gracilis TaxID=423350 RepID=A0A495IX60_9SPHI|nr:hypothetical protein BDD43_0753 [Mucilaginibacter gracilis]
MICGVVSAYMADEDLNLCKKSIREHLAFKFQRFSDYSCGLEFTCRGLIVLLFANLILVVFSIDNVQLSFVDITLANSRI